MSKSYKCVVVGDACVGKTCMVMRITGRELDEKYIPTIVENAEYRFQHRGETRILNIWDTAGQEDYRNLRTKSYSSVDVFLLCFSLVDRDSFENLSSVWLPELRSYEKDAIVLLVGTKHDLCREDGSRSAAVSRAKIDELCGSHGSLKYVECSALKNYGIKEVVEQTLDLIFGVQEVSKAPSGRSRRSGKRCDIL
ncbi:hypothetical protein BOX15_Mlig011074g1 [Macrostomum lignano]|uniref:Uncharacterized protein n=1 Tax=Macrostomum lignano TaxID=282301 RepID=A0A267DWJ4_9PLAT|nr:hypothetical protein BOX15_Mlig011074g1 [Macrostomum lignano]